MIKNYKINFDDSEIYSTNEQVTIQFTSNANFFEFILIFNQEVEVSKLSIDFEFNSTIELWRNFDYQWVQVNNQQLITNYYAPKILKLENNIKIVAKNTLGCWEIKDKNTICWHLIHPMLNPTMFYDNQNAREFITKQKINKNQSFESGLLWTTGTVEEFARTPIGFKPIVCFTDHCDFDTNILLQKQRVLFKENTIKTSKGFFLYPYSHKSYTVSLADKNTEIELKKWEADGHEMVYHALSQSFNGKESFKEFQEFESPKGFKTVSCYIDHGYQPYNYTKQKIYDIINWYKHIETKKINLIWNYLDSGEGNLLTVNQINAEAFTIKSIFKSRNLAKKNGIKRKLMTDIRNFIMYGVDEHFLIDAKIFGGSLKQINKKPSKLFKTFPNFIKHFLRLNFWKALLFSNNKVFTYSKFTPVFFKAINQNNTDITVFQSVSIRDFDICFSDLALKNLVQQKGILIAHTYFAYLGKNHEGRLFENESGAFRKTAKDAFIRLGIKIKNQEIWNPTISEMKELFDNFHQLEYVLEQNNLVIKNFNGIKRVVE